MFTLIFKMQNDHVSIIYMTKHIGLGKALM